jgi:low affinity Fe/Cu permease
MNELFSRLANQTARQAGRASTFMISIAIVLVWAASGPFFHWSDTWQLVINTGTTIITFLMVFLIQNTQNRDTQALHLKIDELIRVTVDARNSMMTLEDATEHELDVVKAELQDQCGEETPALVVKPRRKPPAAAPLKTSRPRA